MEQPLENGLILRTISAGYASDRATLTAFYQENFPVQGDYPDAIGPWSDDFLTGQHPTVSHDDMYVIVDPAQNDKIVSALLLIPQVWRYEEVLLPTGRVEIVATDKAYRRRGLIRILMDAIHQRSAALGHQLQVITGIPHYYRQFGYTMALPLGADAMLPFTAVPKLKDEEVPKFTLRPATNDDIPNLMRWYDQLASRSLVSVIRTEDYWRYELNGRSPVTIGTEYFHIIENQAGQAVGYTGVGSTVWGKRLSIWQYVVDESTSYLETFDDVMRGLKTYAEAKYDEKIRPDYISFDNGMPQAVKTMIRKTYPGWSAGRTYAWYLRVADPVQLMITLAPVLERRLKGSGANNYTGELGIQMFEKGNGLLLKFESGRLTHAEMKFFDDDENAAFPWHSFWNVVFGYSDPNEMWHLLPESFTDRTAAVLLEAMFPKRPSWVIGVL